MNRKYRAKKLENGNEWVYGYYLYIPQYDCHYILTGNIVSYPIDLVHPHLTTSGFEWILVDGKTVQQATGAFDKSSNEVYDGDVVKVYLTQDADIKVYSPETTKTGVVVYNENNANYFLKGNFMHFNDWSYNDFEVIGNIIDNPELLKECK